MSNLGFINSQLNLPPNTPPPSMSVGNVGLNRSPFSQDVGALTRFLSNRVVKPVANYTTNKINPIIDDVSQYFGYGNVSPNVIPKVPTTNISGKQIFSNIQDTGSNLINKVGGILVPSANEGEDKLINNINSGLLTNEQIVNQNNGSGTGQSLLDTKDNFNNRIPPSNTYDSQTSNNTTTNNTTTANNQTVGKTTNNETVTTKQKKTSQTLGVESQDPNAEVVATPNGEGTPTNKFMDKFVNFAQSEFGKDFFASLAEKSGPKIRKPQSFGSNVGSAYKDAREKQLEREKIKGENSQDGTYRGTIDSEKGTTHMVFTDKGKSYVNIDGKRVYEKDFGKVLGKNYSYRTMGQQSLGILGSKPFGDLSQDLNNDEVSLNLYIEYLDNIGDSSKGIKRMGDIFSARIKNILGEDPSQEQLATLLASADLPGIVGRSRLEIAGPGVMTDKDFLFILENLGGDVNSLQNPLVVQEQISKLFANKYKNFETKRKIYNANVSEEYKKYGYEKINPLEFSDRQLKLLSINTLVKNNLTNLETYDTASLQDIINSANANPETIDKALEVLESRNLDD